MKQKRLVMRFILLIPCFLILATVFVVNEELTDGVISGKYFWFYLSMGIMAVLSIITVTKNKQSLQFSRFDILILLFGLTSYLFGYRVHGSEAITKHILLILLILLYFYFKIALQTQKSASYWVLLFLMTTGLVEAIWGMMQLYGYSISHHTLFKLTGSFFNPGFYAGYLAVVLPVAFYYLLRNWNCTKSGFKSLYLLIYLRWGIALLSFLGILLVLPAGMSRASWLSGAGGCGIIVYFYFKKNSYWPELWRKNKKKSVFVDCLFSQHVRN